MHKMHYITEGPKGGWRNIKDYKDPTLLTQWVKFFLWLHILMAVVAIASNLMEYQLLSDFQNGSYANEEEATADAEASDQRQLAIGIAYVLIFIIGGFLILKWIYRANYNVRQLGAEGMKFSSGWSVGWYFVPIVNLWKPFHAMQEIWKTSHSPKDWKNSDIDKILPCWWILWIISNLLGRTALKMGMRAESIDELMNANLVSQASEIAWIPLCLLFTSLVNKIYAAQITCCEELANERGLD